MSRFEETGKTTTDTISSVPSNDIEKTFDTKDVVGISTDAVYEVDRAAERRLVWRMDIRILPASMFIYVLNFLARANIGNAKILNENTGNSLDQTLQITDHQYTVALMVFLIAYMIFQIPSNYLLKRCYPSRWIAFLMFGWGLMTLCLGFVKNFSQLTAVRFLLGAFEAGLFPGLIYFLTFWYKPRERAVRIALIAACATLGGGFSGVIAFCVGLLNKSRGLEGWRLLFIIEGVPSCFVAFFVWFFFPDYPETARWLSPKDKELAVNRIKGEVSLGHAKITWDESRRTLLDWRLYLHYLAFVAISIPFSSFQLFAPTIVAGLGFENLRAQLFTVPPYAIAFVSTVITSRLADKYEMWSWGSFVPMALSGISFLVLGLLPTMDFKARYGMLCMAASWAYACNPSLLSWLTANLKSTTATSLSVALNVTLGTLGQIIGVYIYKTDEAPTFPTGHFTNAAALLFAAALVLWLRVVYIRRNRVLPLGEGLWRL
ncbi:MFS general substrate transporter [Stereum hirsutum FP-91666 SS1]|uniref:MFS general substrate transporter n=1 Tax=Stereum hirsutum (strain FP-91666) TaxID=721885 RepID=UPI000444929B|nr:MFS general substrate transporter [Stereum hirsutum FP-91666 SS1]EIM84794.1 MFS general substrate transporter [Stereum hirsutum FP-91666 SS1]